MQRYSGTCGKCSAQTASPSWLLLLWKTVSVNAALRWRPTRNSLLLGLSASARWVDGGMDIPPSQRLLYAFELL